MTFAFIYNNKYVNVKSEHIELESKYDSLYNVLFTYKREQAAGIILYNTYTIKSNLTLKQAKTLDSLMFALTDSSDIERIVKQYKLEGTVWQN